MNLHAECRDGKPTELETGFRSPAPGGGLGCSSDLPDRQVFHDLTRVQFKPPPAVINSWLAFGMRSLPIWCRLRRMPSTFNAPVLWLVPTLTRPKLLATSQTL